jgi:low temperature requirement protein LtrA
VLFGAKTNVLRVRKAHEPSKVTFVELFFDLVFVFAITQISHFLLEHFSPLGVFEALLLLLAVWWVWIDTSWCTNWLDPDRAPVRVMLFALMLAGLVVSTSIPDAFGGRGLSFAVAFVFMQVGRSLFMLLALRGRSAANFRNFQRITIWLVCAGIFWIAGGFSQGSTRIALWSGAVAIETAGPLFYFFVPGLGRSQVSDWDVEGHHMAERCGLFIIIALGESILVTGATFARLDWTLATGTAFVVAFTGSVTMWWIYFNIGAERASHLLSSSADPGRLARFAYTYVHILLIAGIIVSAVADELVLAHPGGHTNFRTAATTIGGPALFLIGNVLFKRTYMGWLPLSHLAGIGLLALWTPFALVLPPLAFGAGATLILIVVAAWETLSLRPSIKALPAEEIAPEQLARVRRPAKRKPSRSKPKPKPRRR